MRRKAENIGTKVVWLDENGGRTQMVVVAAPAALPTLRNKLIDTGEILTVPQKVDPQKIREALEATSQEIKDFQEEMEDILSELEKSKKILEKFSKGPVVGPMFTTDPYVFRVVGFWVAGPEGPQDIDELASALKKAGLDPQLERFYG